MNGFLSLIKAAVQIPKKRELKGQKKIEGNLRDIFAAVQIPKKRELKAKEFVLVFVVVYCCSPNP